MPPSTTSADTFSSAPRRRTSSGPMLIESFAPTTSLLTAPESLPLRPASTVMSFGPTLVVAPHPDDESLGCGGALALLGRAGLPVWLLFVSDGAGSHPGSRRYPAPALRVLRESEARAA